MRTWIMLLAVLALLLVTFSLADAKGKGKKGEGVTVNATGTLTATGDGLAHVRIFSGTLTITGQGRLRVSAAAQVQITGDAGKEVEHQNKKTGQPNWDVYKKFNGTATITGANVHVYLKGTGITVNAQGAGRAHLVGTGQYSIQTQGKAAENGHWAAKPAAGTAKTDKHAFEKSIRRVYGDYAFKNGKEDTEGDADLFD